MDRLPVKTVSVNYEEIDDAHDKQPLLPKQEEVQICVKIPLKAPAPNHIRLLTFRCFCLYLFIVALDLGSLTVKQYIFKFFNDRETNQALNSSVRSTNRSHDATVDECGKNVSKSAESSAQTLSAQWDWYLKLVEHGGAIPFTFILTFYSDFIGRKRLMQLSLLGNLARYVGCGLVVYFGLELNYLFIGYSLDAVVGCHYTFISAAMASIADLTDQEHKRSMGIGLIEAVTALGVSASSLGSGYFISYTGYFYPCVATASVNLFLFVVMTLFDQETLREKKKVERSPKKTLLDMISLFTRKENVVNRQLWQFRLSILLTVPVFMSYFGERTVLTFVQLGYPFCYTAEMIGYYGASDYLWRTILGLAMLKAFQRCGLPNEVAFIFGLLSCVGAMVVTGFAKDNYWMYGGVAVGGLTMLMFASFKSMGSNLVVYEKQGLLFGTIYIMENIGDAFAGYISSSVYKATVTTAPGCVFFVMAGIAALDIVIVMPLLIAKIRDKEKAKT